MKLPKNLEGKAHDLALNESQFCQCKGIVCHGCQKITIRIYTKGYTAGALEVLEQCEKLAKHIEKLINEGSGLLEDEKILAEFKEWKGE